MKKLMLSTAILAATSFGALAQDATSSLFRESGDMTEIRASDFIGKRVYSIEGDVAANADGMQENWEDIGEINDVILSREGDVQAVLVDIGGFLGIGERQVAINMDAIRFVSDDATADDEGDYFLVMSAARTDFEAAPEWQWQTGDDQAMTDPAAGTTEDVAATDAPAEDTEMAGTETDPATDPATGAAMDETEMAGTETDPAAADETDPAATGIAPRAEGGIWPEGYALADASALTAETLTGATVYDAEDTRIGSVSDLVVGEGDTLTHAVVDVGGFLGIGAKPVALDMAEIQIVQADGGDELRVYVPMTRDQIDAMPRFEG
jgi:sporulation protein YlmC with PRC-barrel domain